MKKPFAIIIIYVMVLGLLGCNNNSTSKQSNDNNTSPYTYEASNAYSADEYIKKRGELVGVIVQHFYVLNEISQKSKTNPTLLSDKKLKSIIDEQEIQISNINKEAIELQTRSPVANRDEAIDIVAMSNNLKELQQYVLGLTINGTDTKNLYELIDHETRTILEIMNKYKEQWKNIQLP
ncbi:MAG: hypothetical protein K6T66_13430 [Peptococcaceae bacterium]|nr:hypothetical protein [Peptococcaceae bacterium]